LVEPAMLAAVKAAAPGEYNAPDYVAYLKRVFAEHRAANPGLAGAMGPREAQHGRALGRWAEMADPSFKLKRPFARFRKGYYPAPFHCQWGNGSVRGSRRARSIARCVVESGTSSYYSAIRDASRSRC